MQGNTYQHVFLQRLQGSAGSPHIFASAPAEPVPKGKEKKNPNQGLGRWVPPCWGSPRAGAASAGPGGQENHFLPPNSHCWDFSPLGAPSEPHFRRARQWGMLVPTPLSSGERARERGAELQKPPLDRVWGGLWGGSHVQRGHRALPHSLGNPSGSSKRPCGTAMPGPGGCWGTGTPCLSPPRAVMSSSTRNSSVQDYFPSPFGLLFQGTGLIHRKNMKFRLRAAKMGEFQRISILREPGRVSVAGRLMK